jgi:hypothetical protein
VSLTLEEIGALDTSLRLQIKKLKDEVLYELNPFALISLLDIALLATRTLHALWSESGQITVLSTRHKADLVQRREWLRFYRAFRDDFPILHSWRGRREQKQMLNDLQYGPIKTKALRQKGMSHFVTHVVMPVFLHIQYERVEPMTAIERAIQEVPPLSFATRKQWADAAVLWACERWPNQLKKPGSPLWKLAKPEAERDREKRKGIKRQRDLKTKREKESGVGGLDPIAATKIQKRQDYFARLAVSESHFRTGLKTQIIAYLERNLPAKKLSP